MKWKTQSCVFLFILNLTWNFKKMSSIKKIGGWFWGNKIKLILLAGLVGGGFYYWQKKQSTASSAGTNKLKTAVVEKGDIEVLVSGSGQVEAASQVDLKPQVAGDGLDIISVEVENNQEVKKNDLIAILDTTDALKTLRDAELSLRASEIKQTQVNDASDNQTKEDKLIRQTQEADVQQKVNKLTDAKSELEDYYIRAPFDGVVTGLDFSAGDSVSRDEILASVITEEMIATISLNEVDAVKVEKGAVVNLTFSALDDVKTTGEVSKIDTIGTVSQGVVSYDAEISFNASKVVGLKPGMSVEAEIITESAENVVAVPVSAVQSNPKGEDYVIIVEKGLIFEELSARINSASGQTKGVRSSNIPEGLKMVTVTVGVTDDVIVEISGEISEGETVLTQTIESLKTVNATTNKSDNSSTASKSLIPTMGGGGQRGGGGR